MKVQEFRIGNLVEAYIEPPVSEWVEIEVSLNTLLTITSKPYTHGYRPIPLTEEWLLKFGFEKKGRFYRRGAITVEILNNFCRICIAGNFISNIEFVHSMQNLYFCLSKKELI